MTALWARIWFSDCNLCVQSGSPQGVRHIQKIQEGRQLQDAVNMCIEAAGNETDTDVQTKLLQVGAAVI